jgi:putative membrane protein
MTGMNAMTSLAGLGPFLAYFAGALVAEAIFLAIYMAVTPHHEMRLIRAGNTAAAMSLAGAVLGFTFPLASAIAHAVSYVDFAVWAGVALVVQIVVFLVANYSLGGLSRRVDTGDMAAGAILATASLAMGIINAACMTY